VEWILKVQISFKTIKPNSALVQNSVTMRLWIEEWKSLTELNTILTTDFRENLNLLLHPVYVMRAETLLV